MTTGGGLTFSSLCIGGWSIGSLGGGGVMIGKSVMTINIRQVTSYRHYGVASNYSTKCLQLDSRSMQVRQTLRIPIDRYLATEYDSATTTAVQPSSIVASIHIIQTGLVNSVSKSQQPCFQPLSKAFGLNSRAWQVFNVTVQCSQAV